MLHDASLKALNENLEERKEEKLTREFDSCIKEQISGAVIGTKFAPTYLCIFLDKVENELLESSGY